MNLIPEDSFPLRPGSQPTSTNTVTQMIFKYWIIWAIAGWSEHKTVDTCNSSFIISIATGLCEGYLDDLRLGNGVAAAAGAQGGNTVCEREREREGEREGGREREREGERASTEPLPLSREEGITSTVLKAFALTMAQAKARIWP